MGIPPLPRLRFNLLYFSSCAPGYYGNPLVIGSSCQPCDCSGNTDPNMLFSSCDSLTGACMGCMHHTAGARCEVCAPGFYGDAVAAKNCTREWGRQQTLGGDMDRLTVDVFSTLAGLCVAPVSRRLGCTRCRHPLKMIIRKKTKPTPKTCPSSITTP